MSREPEQQAAPDPGDILLVLCNLPDAATARRLAEVLVQERAAACVNILSPCVSVYRWQEEMEAAEEVPMLIKTTRAAYPGLEKLIRSHHPYELPEIIAVSLATGLPGYLQWVAQETSQK